MKSTELFLTECTLKMFFRPNLLSVTKLFAECEVLFSPLLWFEILLNRQIKRPKQEPNIVFILQFCSPSELRPIEECKTVLKAG